MAEKKPNRRALKTRKAIFEGLAELLCEKELPRITVNELTEKADIHRATFYKHFLDIYDVYEKLEMTILSDIGLIMTSHDEKAPLALYTDILTYVKAHPQCASAVSSVPPFSFSFTLDFAFGIPVFPQLWGMKPKMMSEESFSYSQSCMTIRIP